MAKRKLPPKMWVYAPRSAPKAKVPEAVKIEVFQQGQRLIDEWKPQYVKAPPEDYQFNYIVDLFTYRYPPWKESTCGSTASDSRPHIDGLRGSPLG
jgi:hypothetical protein